MEGKKRVKIQIRTLNNNLFFYYMAQVTLTRWKSLPRCPCPWCCQFSLHRTEEWTSALKSYQTRGLGSTYRLLDCRSLHGRRKEEGTVESQRVHQCTIEVVQKVVICLTCHRIQMLCTLQGKTTHWRCDLSPPLSLLPSPGDNTIPLSSHLQVHVV